METRVYMGDRSPDRIYNPIYSGKVKLARVHEALYMIFTKVACIQVREQDFERVLTKKMVSPLQDGY
jgi:hypothetical protein